MPGMELKELQASFDRWGRSDPLWAIATVPDKKGNRWDRDEFFQTGESFVRDVMEFVRGLPVSIATRGTALDFGCGVGRLTQPLALRFDRVVGVDIAPSMIELARAYNRRGDRCRYVLNECDDLSCFPDAHFDFILSHITLQHMAPRYAKAYIREFARVLAPDGLLLFQVPSERAPRALPCGKPAVQAVPPGTAAGSAVATGATVDRTRPADAGPAPCAARRPGGPAPDDPPIEMHGVPRAEVEGILQTGGLALLDVSENRSGGPAWISYRYCAVKSAARTGNGRAD